MKSDCIAVICKCTSPILCVTGRREGGGSKRKSWAVLIFEPKNEGSNKFAAGSFKPIAGPDAPW